ncbi:hypothetical protein LCGC14_2833300, partial [marine sediment metagenome]
MNRTPKQIYNENFGIVKKVPTHCEYCARKFKVV